MTLAEDLAAVGFDLVATHPSPVRDAVVLTVARKGDAPRTDAARIAERDAFRAACAAHHGDRVSARLARRAA